MSFARDRQDAALEEIDRACTRGWDELAKTTPWGDTYEGFTPGGCEVCFERSDLWASEAGGDIRVEVNIYEPHSFEQGARLTRSLSRNGVP